ncbi:hypothetical protein GCM10010129_68900 [Streptomyces fumigatiscleroticus]|nr:hypothetical protein GCM10010129_68900 [Streptomyces fumigatiscleroticus]
MQERVDDQDAGEDALVELRTRLVDALARSQLTKTQLAARARLGRTTVSQAFGDGASASVPTPRTVAALADVLDLPAEELLGLLHRATRGRPVRTRVARVAAPSAGGTPVSPAAGSVDGSGRRDTRAPGPDTVEVLVEQADPPGRFLVLPSSLDPLSDPPVRAPGGAIGSEDVLGWARARGGVDFAYTLLFVTVTNRSDAHLTLRGVRALILDRGEPVGGALVSIQPAGSQAVPELVFDLDEVEPELWEVDEYTRRTVGARPFLDRTHVRLMPDESMKLIITAEVRRSCCTWQLGLAFRPDGEQEFTVRPPSRYRTSGLPVEGVGPVLAWQWHMKLPAFEPTTRDLGWCRVGDGAPQPLAPVPEGETPPDWAAHPDVVRFLPALLDFLTTGTAGPERLRRYTAVHSAMTALDIASRAFAQALAGGAEDEARRVLDDLKAEIAPPLLAQAQVVTLLCHGLSSGRLPADMHDGLRGYIEGTPAAAVLRPVLEAVERSG